MPDRAAVFIDGNNWYHSLKSVGVDRPNQLDYGKISKKLLGPRAWITTRYYIGAVPQTGNLDLYADQRRFVQSLLDTDKKITVYFGRLEPRSFKDPAALELRQYLANHRIMDPNLYRDLMTIAKNHQNATTFVEKAVDVMLAVDMVIMAEHDEFDAAYLLSADGDFTPAVSAIREKGKKVYAVSPAQGAQLASVASKFIRLHREWFADCYL